MVCLLPVAIRKQACFVDLTQIVPLQVACRLVPQLHPAASRLLVDPFGMTTPGQRLMLLKVRHVAEQMLGWCGGLSMHDLKKEGLLAGAARQPATSAPQRHKRAGSPNLAAAAKAARSEKGRQDRTFNEAILDAAKRNAKLERYVEGMRWHPQRFETRADMSHAIQS